MRRIKNTKAKSIQKIYVNKSSTMYFPRFCFIEKVILYNKKDLRDRIILQPLTKNSHNW